MRFILVHGGFHGAWCWTRVIPELAALGHDAIAIDLPGHGKRRDEESTIAGRRAAIVDLIDASHSPFLSQPRATAKLLVAAVATRAAGPLQSV